MLEMKIVSVSSKYYHPGPPTWQPRCKSLKFAYFLSNAQTPDLPGNFYFNKLYTFSPLSISKLLEYLQIRIENIYLSIDVKIINH